MKICKCCGKLIPLGTEFTDNGEDFCDMICANDYAEFGPHHQIDIQPKIRLFGLNGNQGDTSPSIPRGT